MVLIFASQAMVGRLQVSNVYIILKVCEVVSRQKHMFSMPPEQNQQQETKD